MDALPVAHSLRRASLCVAHAASVEQGRQECDICRLIVTNAAQAGPNFHNLCNGVYPEYEDMVRARAARATRLRAAHAVTSLPHPHTPQCKAQQKVLQSCPEFVNDWCYQDLGGTQALRSPCPSHLKCHYCLGMNPLYCSE